MRNYKRFWLHTPNGADSEEFVRLLNIGTNYDLGSRIMLGFDFLLYERYGVSLFKSPSGPKRHHGPSDQGAVLWTENRMEEEFVDGDGRGAEFFCAKNGLFPNKAMEFPRPTRATFRTIDSCPKGIETV